MMKSKYNDWTKTEVALPEIGADIWAYYETIPAMEERTWDGDPWEHWFRGEMTHWKPFEYPKPPRGA